MNYLTWRTRYFWNEFKSPSRFV